MKVIVLGASGVIGQHMRLCAPAGVEAIYVRQTYDMLHVGLDLNDFESLTAYLRMERPNAIVNLAGENRPDVVEQEPERYRRINTELPDHLAQYCLRQNIHYVHVSTQAVFSGENPPYHSESPRQPVNVYGAQKYEAEQRISWHASSGWTIVRPTFVLGVRPMPAIGRENPIERMLMASMTPQVNDRFFSVADASDVAEQIWAVAIGQPQTKVIHVGYGRTSRYELALALQREVEPVSHESFADLAPRPKDTTYAGGSPADAIQRLVLKCKNECTDRRRLELSQRANELTIFTGRPKNECFARLQLGFGALHNAVAADYRTADPQNDDELLEWYRDTEAYLWELSAYHADAGFNYTGMCAGVADRLEAAGAKRILCLGDGIGDLTLSLLRSRFDAVYHDLAGSQTSRFAGLRLWMYTGRLPERILNVGWEAPNVPSASFDAICSFDFLEHVTDVPAWVEMIRHALKPGGLFFVQNAFACGSGPDGSIPMHLARNDRFEKDWDPMLSAMGFTQLSSNWYQTPAEVRETVTA